MNKYFIYTGNAYPHKNLERLFKALILLNRSKKEKIKLKISSSRSVFINRLEMFVKDNGMEDYIEILGYVPDKELNYLYKNSIAFVFPTLSEGFGLPPMEAINAGTLVVQSDIPVLKEIYEDCTFYFDPLNIESIARELEKVSNLSKLQRQNKISYSQNFVKKYSWKKMAEETLNVYKSIV